ncbi:MAG: threonine/serine dehydratase [Chloroflexi bacterium]|nr:threonine/serine dehydratase [Chloroflexota bacterium]
MSLPRPPVFADVLDARRAISRYIHRTPLRHYPGLSRLVGADIWVKHENLQVLNVFKVRGGLNLVSRLTPEEKKLGIVTASSGNHGQSISFAGRTFGAAATIVVPEGANPAKVQSIKDLGANVVFHGSHYDVSRDHAIALSREQEMRYVDAANEPLLIAGVATYSLEIFEDLGDIDYILAPVGAGSGASGACIVAEAVSQGTKVIGVGPKAAPAAYLSWKEGRIATAPMRTQAEGLATASGYELPQGILRRLLSDFVLVDEQSIMTAIRTYAELAHTLVEGAAAAPLAAALDIKDRLKGKRVVLIASGANISPAHLRAVFGGGA